MDLPTTTTAPTNDPSDRPAGSPVPAGASYPVDDRHVEVFEPIATPDEVRAELPTTAAHTEVVRGARAAIAAALRGDDDRMVAVVGPCSIHDTELARDYAQRLAPLARELSD
ncbi:MAG: hypothetical protein ACLFS9_05495, partial [Nitriliruptoraceae bacterium]